MAIQAIIILYDYRISLPYGWFCKTDITKIHLFNFNNKLKYE